MTPPLRRMIWPAVRAILRGGGKGQLFNVQKRVVRPCLCGQDAPRTETENQKPVVVKSSERQIAKREGKVDILFDLGEVARPHLEKHAWLAN